jgi:hypothetical protein
MIVPKEKEFDAVIVMTPHSDFTNKEELDYRIVDFREDCIIADLWKMFPESKLSNTGIYKVGDVL